MDANQTLGMFWMPWYNDRGKLAAGGAGPYNGLCTECNFGVKAIG